MHPSHAGGAEEEEEARVFDPGIVYLQNTSDFFTIPTGNGFDVSGTKYEYCVWSFWFRTAATNPTVRGYFAGSGAYTSSFGSILSVSTIFQQKNRATGGGDVVNQNASVGTWDQSWHHFLFSGSGSNGSPSTTGYIYIDDVQWNGDVVTSGNFALKNFDVTSHYFGRGASAGDHSRGYLAEYFLHAPSSFLDITVEANRRKFISAAGAPVDLGADGSTPLGEQPFWYLGKEYSTFHENLGSLGDLTVNGTIQDGSGVGPIQL
jgi:hypothetical protein